MTDHEGGGASRTTDPAYGSSSATDVSLREHMTALVQALDRHITAELGALRRETEQANHAAERAIGVAADEAKERLLAHNGLIEQMRQQAQQFSSREALDNFKEESDRRFGRLERFQAMLIGGMLLLSFLGIGTLVRVLTG